ncbi:MAG: hypothetical protein KatS3mg111_1928 [Pirellulaceae bacterium]|nr:MAG: hypothetical protein KatS3mg111_1928 [Pirellulaceae bacterium]
MRPDAPGGKASPSEWMPRRQDVVGSTAAMAACQVFRTAISRSIRRLVALTGFGQFFALQLIDVAQDFGDRGVMFAGNRLPYIDRFEQCPR